MPVPTSITALHDGVVVRVEKAKKSAGGVYLAENMTKEKRDLDRGVVVAVGSGRRTDFGTTIYPVVQPGDRVAFSQPLALMLEEDGDCTLYVVRDQHIAAILPAPSNGGNS